MILLALFALALVGVTVTLLAWASVLPRVHAVERLSQIGAYGVAVGPERNDAAAGTSSMLDGLARRVGAVAARTVGVREEDLRRQLMAAGVYRLGPNALLGYRVLAALSMPLLILAVAPDSWTAPMQVAAAALACFGGWAVPLVLLKRRARRRLDKIDYALPGMIDLLVVTVEAGLGLGSSLQIGSDKLGGPLGDELRLMLQEQRMGLPTKDALKNMAVRADTAGMRTFVRAMVQGEELGVSIGEIMRAVSVDMRKLRRAMAEERAHKAPVKMLFPLVFLIFPAMFLLLLGPAVIDLVDALGKLQ